MRKTVFITGSSLGIGKETALYFAEREWNVVATMRTPASADISLKNNKNIYIYYLDVLKSKSIIEAINFTIEKFKTIDVLVNNAGFATTGVFETSTEDHIEKQFATNVFGLFDVTKQIIPVLKKQKYGTIINIASILGRMGTPLNSLYISTKWAIEGFSESLAFELDLFNIKVKLIEPGIIKSDFWDRSMKVVSSDNCPEYQIYREAADKKVEKMVKKGSSPIIVAKTIYRAAVSTNKRFRYLSGKDARILSAFRLILPDSIFINIFK